MIWGRLYSQNSFKEKGKLYHLRNLINRTSVPSDPEKNMNASEDFMLLILHTHVISAANMFLSLNPSASVRGIAMSIVNNYVHLPREDDVVAEKCDDGIHVYATEVLSLCLIWHGFHDAIREGDGERVLLYWKILLVVFKSSNRRNYGKEAVNMLLQYYYILSDREKAQLLWGRFINTRGCQGTNIPCDLFMEHLNRRLKIMIRGMGANVNAKSIQKAGRAIASVHHVCQQFEQQTANYLHSDYHPYPRFGKDFETVLQVLDEEVFLPIFSQNHSTFKFQSSIMHTLSRSDLLKKVDKSIGNIYSA